MIGAQNLRITMPSFETLRNAKIFLEMERQAIKTKQNRMAQKPERQRFVIDEAHPLETLTFSARVARSSIDKIRFHWEDEKHLTIEYPQGIDCNEKNIQEAFCKGIHYFLKKEAHRVLPARLKLLAEGHGFSYAGVKIQSSTSRWGSCSSTKHINLSFYLLILPQKLIDSVILHELCHTVEMNHGPKFWALLDKACGEDAKNLKKEVNKYKMPIAK